MIELLAAAIGAVLYRLRGGAWRNLTGDRRWWNGTHAMRAIWSVPTGALMAEFSGAPWWLSVPLVVSVFLSLALLGHGAHMVFDRDVWLRDGVNRTELLTFWLPWVFGEPNRSWSNAKIDTYNLIGMGLIGTVRNAIAVMPLLSFAPVFGVVYIATGAAHGLLYLAGWRLGGRSAYGELGVGAISWAVLTVMR